MSLSSLMAISPLDGRYAKTTESLQAFTSEFALIRYRLKIEIEWLIALSEEPIIKELPEFSTKTKDFLRAIFKQFSEKEALDIKAIEKETAHDVKAVEYFLKEKCATLPELHKATEFIHFACTSEDINNLAYALMLKGAFEEVLFPTMEKVQGALAEFAKAHKSAAMLARTHGQPASPTTMGKEWLNTLIRLYRLHESLKTLPFYGKINGAVGNFNAHVIAYPEVDWLGFSEKFVTNLGLSWNAYTTQIEPHDYIAALFDTLSRYNTVLVDFARDQWLYISQGYFVQKISEKEIGSSTMPHKVNPIHFENAEGNLELGNSILRFLSTRLMVSRLQRDLTDSTLLRNIGVGLGHSLIAYHSLIRGASTLLINKIKIKDELNCHIEILSEAVQTVMRRYGLPAPYEKLKALTRGKSLDAETWQAFIKNLALPDAVKTNLSNLLPEDYKGNTICLIEKGLKEIGHG
jgi:adenylosuccinate lyase